MDLTKMCETLKRKGVIFIEEDYEEVAVRLQAGKDATLAFIKRKGRKEARTITSNKMVFDAIIYGKEISKEEYDNY